MTALRQQMLDAMELRAFAQRTREAYLHWVIELARHTHTAPEQLAAADLEAFLLHLLRERHLAPATCAQALQALRFLWCVVLKRPDIVVDLPSPNIMAGLAAGLKAGNLHLPPGQVPDDLLAELTRRDWVVYAKTPFAGPAQVLAYLGRYTHRTAIGNQRLVALADGQVKFRWRDRAHGNQVRVMTLPAEDFIHRFLLHVLPKGFQRIRHYGLLANRHKAACLARARHWTCRRRNRWQRRPWRISRGGCWGWTSCVARSVTRGACA